MMRACVLPALLAGLILAATAADADARARSRISKRPAVSTVTNSDHGSGSTSGSWWPFRRSSRTAGGGGSDECRGLDTRDEALRAGKPACAQRLPDGAVTQAR